MKILLVNKYLYPRGGDCLYTLRLMKLLQSLGHTVIPFGMHHPQNIRTDYDDYFVPYIDFNDELKKRRIINSFKVATRVIVNVGAVKAINRLIEDTKPDLVHLQNIHHQLTPSIAIAAAQNHIPVVWTLHDYILNCPNDNFYRNNGICTKCASGNNIYAVLHRCKKGSIGASILAYLESTIYHRLRLAHYVSRFICPSRFLAGILTAGGIPSAKVTVIPNFLQVTEPVSSGEDYFIYAGRLTVEKGVDLLLRAFREFGKGRLFIAGDGPQRQSLQELARSLDLNNVEFLGYQQPAEIQSLLAGCRASIVPSICFENLPYAVMETMMAGKTAIASRIGGIPEMIEHEKTGLLFEPGNSTQLAKMLERIWESKNLARRLGSAAREKVISEYSPDKHYERIVKVYSESLGIKQGASPDIPDYGKGDLTKRLIESRKG